MKVNVTLSSVDDRAVEQLFCCVQICDHDSLITRTVSVLLNCPLTEVYIIVYPLYLFIPSFFF